MQRKIVCIMLMLCAALEMNAQESYQARVKKYIEQYKDWAIAEQKRSGVPAAITLAQGIHETSAGGSELALNANNHFGIKCKKEWNGETYTYTDDAPDECFRKYPSALQSYKDHSDYLAGSKRYEALFKLQPHDYKGWAIGLKRCGYATNPKYSQILIKLVEDYNLQEYTIAALSQDYNPVKDAGQLNTKRPALGREVIPEEDAKPSVKITAPATTTTSSMPVYNKRSSMSVSYEATTTPEVKKKTEEEEYLAEDPQTAEYGKLVKINGIKAFYAKKGTVLLEDAFRFNIRYAKLLEINELPDLPLEADMYIYLERKNPKGIHQTHIVKPGETLIQVAQAEAMQLRYLKYYNRIAANEEPMEGAVLYLQQYSENKPPTYVKAVAPTEETTAFAGSNPKAIPQGVTRRRASYITKKEIAASMSEPIGIQKEPAQSEAPTEISKAPAKKDPEENQYVSENIIAPEPATQGNSVKTQAVVIEAKTSVSSSTVPATTDTPAATSPAVENAKRMTEEIAATTPAPTNQLGEEKTDEAATKKDIQKKEEIEYEVVQPAPVVVSNTSAPADVTMPANEEATSHKAETINSLIPAKAEMPTVKAEKSAAAPAKVNVPPIPEEPKDEYAKLKAKLDKVVYASDNSATQPKAEKKQPEAKQEVQQTEAAASSDDKTKIYTVKKGDTAFSIAKKHNITMRQLMEWNKLDFKEVKTGQQLRVKP